MLNCVSTMEVIVTSEKLDPKLVAARQAVVQLIEDGAPDRVVAAGRSICHCYANGLPILEQDEYTIRQHATRRQSQDRYGR